LKSRQAVIEVTALELAERRWYGARFLEQAAEVLPEKKGELLSASTCFEEEHNMMWRILELAGGFNNPDVCIKLIDQDLRIQIAEIVSSAGKKDAEALQHLEKAVSGDCRP
jgi:hypothetical protein